MKKILSVDDHDIVALGLEKMAQQVVGAVIVSKAKDSYEMFQRLRQEPWDLVVLDISLKGKSGLEALKEIKQVYPKLPVLVFSLHTNIEFVRWALRYGAAGYVAKDSPETELAQALQSVLAGGHYVSDGLRDELIFGSESGGHASLSGREFEVLIKIGEGKTVKEIAADLNISENTVDTYRARIKEKMNMRRDAELIRYCIGAKLVLAETPFPDEDSTQVAG